MSLLKQFHQRWLKRRIPPKRCQTLHRGNIFIFPSKVGIGFLGMVLLLWLLGTNYQNNLIVALAFLLLSLVHTCIFYTYANFSGLTIEYKSTEPCFAGDTAQVNLQLHGLNKRKAYYTLELAFAGQEPVVVNVKPKQTQDIVLSLPVPQRGWYRAPRITVYTTYPLGIIRAWTHLDLAIDILAYPKPIEATKPVDKRVALDDVEDIEVELSSEEVGDELSHIRPYQAGDSIRHIAWKTYAKSEKLATKTYASHGASAVQQWFDWNDFSSFSTEGRLSRLCFCVCEAEQEHTLYGVRLPSQELALGAGQSHRDAALKMLALYEPPL